MKISSWFKKLASFSMILSLTLPVGMAFAATTSNSNTPGGFVATVNGIDSSTGKGARLTDSVVNYVYLPTDTPTPVNFSAVSKGYASTTDLTPNKYSVSSTEDNVTQTQLVTVQAGKVTPVLFYFPQLQLNYGGAKVTGTIHQLSTVTNVVYNSLGNNNDISIDSTNGSKTGDKYTVVPGSYDVQLTDDSGVTQDKILSVSSNSVTPVTFTFASSSAADDKSQRIGTVTGSVYDGSGSPFGTQAAPGTVSFVKSGSPTISVKVTNGNYSVVIPTGTYNVIFKGTAGYKNVLISNVMVVGGSETDLDNVYLVQGSLLAPTAAVDPSSTTNKTVIKGKSFANTTVTITDSSNNVVGTAKVTTSAFTITIPKGKDTLGTLNVQAVDAAGNTSSITTL